MELRFYFDVIVLVLYNIFEYTDFFNKKEKYCYKGYIKKLIPPSPGSDRHI